MVHSVYLIVTQCYFYIIASVTVLTLLRVRVLRASNKYSLLNKCEIKM